MWQEYCLLTNMDINTRHDLWKFFNGGIFADELANLIIADTKKATSSTKLSYEINEERITSRGTYSVILLIMMKRHVLFEIQKYLLFLFQR